MKSALLRKPNRPPACRECGRRGGSEGVWSVLAALTVSQRSKRAINIIYMCVCVCVYKKFGILMKLCFSPSPPSLSMLEHRKECQLVDSKSKAWRCC